MVDESVKDQLVGAGIIVFVGILFEALDVDKVLDDFLPSLRDILNNEGVPDSGTNQGTEADTVTDTNTDFTAEDLEQGEP